jgi:sugar phosphate isomerase/epimerase
VRTSLSEISTVGASFAEDVAAYAAAGFDGIGLWEFKLPDDDAANLRLLHDAGLAVTNCIPAIPTILQLGVPGMEGPADPSERIAALCASMHRLARYAPSSIVFLTGPIGDRDAGSAREIVLDGVRQVAAAAREAGVRLGLEPTHVSESHESSFLSSIGEAIALLDEAGVPDVGVMVDSFHVWDTPTLEDDIARHGARITGLHVADRLTPAAPGRVLPGEGVTRPARVLELVRRTGFDGFVDVEIFSTPDAFWALPPDEAARRARAALTPLLSTQ